MAGKTSLIHALVLGVGSLVVAACDKSQEPPSTSACPPCATATPCPAPKDVVPEAELTGCQQQLAEVRAELAALVVTTAAPKTEPPPKDTPQAPAPEATPPSEPTPFIAAMFAKPSRRFVAMDGDVPMTVEVKNIQWQAKRWVIDRHADTYFFHSPKKGHVHVTLDFDVTTDAKNPKLTTFDILTMKDGKPETLARTRTAFYRWADYGTYLGNYKDTRNDFGYHNTVRFTAGAEVAVEALKQPLLLVARRQGCQERRYNRWANPPDSYSYVDCIAPIPSTADAFWQMYHLVAVHRGADLKRLLTSPR